MNKSPSSSNSPMSINSEDAKILNKYVIIDNNIVKKNKL